MKTHFIYTVTDNDGEILERMAVEQNEFIGTVVAMLIKTGAFPGKTAEEQYELFMQAMGRALEIMQYRQEGRQE